MDHLWLRQKPNCDLGNDAECAFRSDKCSSKVVTSSFALRTAEPRKRSICEYNFESEYVICCHTEGETMRSAGVFANVSANGAGLLTGRIRGVEKSEMADLLR